MTSAPLCRIIEPLTDSAPPATRAPSSSVMLPFTLFNDSAVA
jgi:hypothetical protein